MAAGPQPGPGPADTRPAGLHAGSASLCLCVSLLSITFLSSLPPSPSLAPSLSRALSLSLSLSLSPLSFLSFRSFSRRLPYPPPFPCVLRYAPAPLFHPEPHLRRCKARAFPSSDPPRPCLPPQCPPPLPPRPPSLLTHVHCPQPSARCLPGPALRVRVLGCVAVGVGCMPAVVVVAARGAGGLAARD